MILKNHVKSRTILPCGVGGILSCILLTGCYGISGNVAGSSTSGNGVVVTEVRARGIEIRNFPGGIGIHVGYRDSLFVQPSSGNGSLTGYSERRGFVPLSATDPVFYSTSGWGVEFAWDDSFRGASFGLRSQAIALLPKDSSAVLIADPTNPNPNLRFLYYNYP